MRRRPRLADTLQRALLCAALGVLTTVTVAWSLAALLPHRGFAKRFNLVMSEDAPGRPEYVSIIEFRRAGLTRRMWHASGPLTWPAAYAAHNNGAAIDMGFKPRQDRSWGHIGAALELGGPRAGNGMEEALGWPWLALWCALDAPAIDGGTSGQRRVTGGIEITSRRFDTASCRTLPLMPIPRGLVADTALFAVGWAVVIPVFRAGRARIRRWRGRCPECAYALSAEPRFRCPECGWTRGAVAQSR